MHPVDKGDGGLEQLVNEFNQSQIQYAFCVATDTITDISRFILINWVNESGGCWGLN